MAKFDINGMVEGEDTTISLYDILTAKTDAGVSTIFANRTSNALDNKVSIELLYLYEKLFENISNIIGEISHDDSPNEETTIGDKLRLIQGSINTLQNIAGAPEVIGALGGVGIYDNGFNGDIKYIDVSNTENVIIDLYPIYALNKFGSNNYAFKRLDTPSISFSVSTGSTDYYYLVASNISGELFVGSHNPFTNPSIIKAIEGYYSVDSVAAATTAAITLENEQTVDGVSLVAGDRVLVKDQIDIATSGYQEWEFTSAKVGTDSTGLTNDTTVYSATVEVDGNDETVEITGSSAQTIDALVSEIDTALTNATCTFDDTNDLIKITSDSSGTGSTISITDTDLFSSVTDMAASPNSSIDGTSDGNPANGIYTVVAGGSWTRTGDVLQNNSFIHVSDGVTNGNTGWVLITEDPITLDSTPLVFDNYVNQVGSGNLYLIDDTFDKVEDLIKYEKEGNTLIPLFRLKFAWSGSDISDVYFQDMRSIVPSVLDSYEFLGNRIYTEAEDIEITSPDDITELSIVKVNSVTFTNVNSAEDNLFIVTKRGIDKLISPDLYDPGSRNENILYYVTTITGGAITPLKGGYSNFNDTPSRVDAFLYQDHFYMNVPIAFYYRIYPTDTATPITLTIDYDYREVDGNGEYTTNILNGTTSFQLTPDSGYVTPGEPYSNFVFPLSGGILFEDEWNSRLFTSTITPGSGYINQDVAVGSGMKSSHYSEDSILSTHINGRQILEEHIEDDQVVTRHIAESNVTGTEIAVQTINTDPSTKDNIANSGIWNHHINNDEIEVIKLNTTNFKSSFTGSAYIKDQSIINANILDAALSDDKFALKTINSGTRDVIADDGITTTHITNGAIINSKMAVDSVATPNVQNLSIINSKIADLTIQNGKIANNTIQVVKLNQTNFKFNFNKDYINTTDLRVPYSDGADNLLNDNLGSGNYLTSTDLVPIGSIIAMHPAASAPDSTIWALCDGSSVPVGTALYGVLSGNVFPNLTDYRFLCGVSSIGTNPDGRYGDNNLYIGADNLPEHTHPTTTYDHTHGVSGNTGNNTHDHNMGIRTEYSWGSSGNDIKGPYGGDRTSSNTHSHSINLTSSNDSHSHTALANSTAELPLGVVYGDTLSNTTRGLKYMTVKYYIRYN